jgi:ABC-2 type transport system ATP-binding protein
MGTNVIEIEGLRKEYHRRKGRTVAVDGLDLEVPEGGVFGFLGPNGSGKTTTIRCVLGLARATKGSVRLFGRPVPDDLAESIRQVGAIVESPALLPTMSGRDNLLMLGAIDHIGRPRVDAVLEEVGLADRGDDQVHKYSLGMRQRLALGTALLKDPALLILDEPANGLDPAGIRSVRELLRRLGDEGRTVFVSSHQLSEIQQTCDRVAILSRGHCVTHGTVTDVISASGTATMLVAVDDPTGALTVLHRAGIGAEPTREHLRVSVAPCDAGRVSRTLGEHGHWVRELRPEERSLEELFLEMTDDRGVTGTATLEGADA